MRRWVASTIALTSILLLCPDAWAGSPTERLRGFLLEQEPSASNRPAVVVEAASPGTPLARVRVGPFSHRSEAASKLREIQARGHKPFIAEERH
jgi:hypothetical protein